MCEGKSCSLRRAFTTSLMKFKLDSLYQITPLFATEPDAIDA